MDPQQQKKVIENDGRFPALFILNGDDTAQRLAKALLGAEEAYRPKR